LTDAIRDAGKGSASAKPMSEPSTPPVPDEPSVSDDAVEHGADQHASRSSAAKDISRDQDASGREIPDAGGAPDEDAPR
jgi:hypothetical protein